MSARKRDATLVALVAEGFLSRLSFGIIGFALPLTSAIGHANDVIDMTIWGVIALAVQVVAYYLARLPVPDLSKRIAAGELGPAIWLGCASVTAGLINAASMSS